MRTSHLPTRADTRPATTAGRRPGLGGYTLGPPTFRRHLIAGLALPVLSLAMTAPPLVASAAPVSAVSFDIPAGPLDAALRAYAAQSHQQILYTPELVAGRRAPAVHGALPARQVLRTLLADSPITATTIRPDVIVLKAADADKRGASFPAAPLGIERVTAQGAPTVLETLVVTGSHIRGARDAASPIVTFGRDDIDRSGRATVADALNALPQNFGGLGTPASLLAGSDRTGVNSQAANGVNLRGLGADATLVLVDGRRLAGTGLRGDFADVSSIPTAAIARVDVLLDGASALYGSDAVGGVVNIILRRDFDGAETRARVGIASGSAARETQFAQTVGKTWDGGHALFSYEYYDRDPLPAAKRDYAASDDLRPFGGTDHRGFYTNPGNILVFDTPTNAYKPAYAIPAGQNGSSLTTASFRPGTANYGSARDGSDILPGQSRNSLYAAFAQDLSATVELSADARFSRRVFAYASAPATTALSIGSANPHFVMAPDGQTSQLIAYSFGEEIGPVQASGASESLALTTALRADLGRTWRVEGYAAFAQEIGASLNANLINSAYLTEALGGADNASTGFRATRDGYFNPYGDAGANSATILDFISSGYSRARNVSRNETINLQADGTLFALPAGDVKMAAGANWRREIFRQQNRALLSTALERTGQRLSYQRTVSSAYAELRVPLVSPDAVLPGVRRLDLSLAARMEDFSDVGRTTNPKVGLAWEPVEGLALRATYGTSFRAPSLSEVYEAPDVSASFLTRNGARTLSLIQYGGNLDLKPETATSWTAGFDVTPPALPGLKVSGTWFRTDFSDRIGQPARENLTVALRDPTLASFVHIIDPGSAADLARVNALITFPTYPYQGLFPASAYGAIVDARWVNTASVQVQGVDGQIGYSFDRGADRFDLSANASYLLTFERQVTPQAAPVDVVGVAGNPARFRGRAQAAWRRGSVSASLAVNYQSQEKDLAGKTIDSWTTTDLQLGWTSDREGPLGGLTLALSVQNLFDTPPPFYDSPAGIGFDAANADPLGRFVSLQLTKRW